MWRRKRCENFSGRPFVPVQSFAGRGEITGGKVGHRPIWFSRTRFSSQVAKETGIEQTKLSNKRTVLINDIGITIKKLAYALYGGKVYKKCERAKYSYWYKCEMGRSSTAWQQTRHSKTDYSRT